MNAAAAPVSLRTAVVILLIEAAGCAVAAGFFGYELATQPALSLSSGITLAVFAVGLAAALVVLARLLHRRQRAARGPATFLQLLMVPIGGYMVSGGLPLLGLPVIALGLGGVVALLAPGTRAALGIE